MHLELRMTKITSINTAMTDMRNKKVLIIDDDSQVTNHLRHSLIQHGLEDIITASNASEGMSLFTGESPDITFLDINLPDKYGLTVLAELLKYNCSAYIVMISGDSTVENVKKSIDGGAKGFIVKPYNIKKIIESMSGLET